VGSATGGGELGKKTALDRLEQRLKIVSSVAGIAVPFLVLWVGYEITEKHRLSDSARDRSDKTAALIAQVLPMALDSDPRRAAIAIQLIRTYAPPGEFTSFLLEVSRSPEKATSKAATDAIINTATPIQITDASARTPDTAKTATAILTASYVVAIITVSNSSDADAYIQKTEPDIKRIDPKYTLHKFPDDLTGLIGIGIVPPLDLKNAQELAATVRSFGLSRDAYLKPTSQLTFH
jgi:hypothetical protein